MNRIKLFLSVAFLCIISYGIFSVCNLATMTTDEKFLFANIEALTNDENGASRNCFYVIENCWFWDCSTIVSCKNCEMISASNWSVPGNC